MTTAAAASGDALADASLALISSLQHPSGAYPASPTFSAYAGYCWFRDGSFIADGMSAAGDPSSADRFFEWCSSVVLDHRDQISRVAAARALGQPLDDSQMLPTRFLLDGSHGSDDWWDFQLDGYGTWLWALEAHARRHGRLPDSLADAVMLTVDYLTATWDRPCFDWWEEHTEHRHVSTLGCVGAGLEAAIAMEILDSDRADRAEAVAREIRMLISAEGVTSGHLTKWLGSSAVDASLLALIAPMGYLPPDSALTSQTLTRIESELAVDGGMHRYLGDTFFGGGQWPLLSCFAGLAHAAMGDHSAARAYLAWAAGTVRDGSSLPEQVPDHLLAPDFEQEWIDRWGPVATPLLWSHAMYLRLRSEVSR
ncbi:glycoside hydrolase family 15 protein [Demequina aestuarii]|uniref:glycoside hydrolase family 15 protein n=1 Tax=Demequina aestuarii TaxID=327095 RepID=UPI000784EDBB|nr:glycoside hydrolase family 15 protein [Demequina aestuarii]